MKSLPFLLIVLVAIGAIYAWTISKEGFATYNSNSEMLKAQGKSIIDEEAVEVGGKQKPVEGTHYSEDVRSTAADMSSYGEKASQFLGNEPSNQASGALPAAGQNTVADTSPSMYQDPDNIPVTVKDLQDLQSNIVLFLRDAYSFLSSASDPTIQLPFSSLQADGERINSELAALSRNPGIPPTLNRKQYEDIVGNLMYLKDKYRRFNYNKPIQGNDTSSDPNLLQKGERATLADLKSARTRMQAEVARLSGGGSLDPTINARVSAINNMIADLSEIITKVENNTLLEIEIPIFKDELAKVFNVIGDTNQRLPGISTNSLPAEVLNMLPPGMENDAESQALLRGLADKYLGDFLKGTSVELKLGARVKYTSDNEARAGGGGNTYAAFFGPLATGQDSTIASQSMLGTSNPGFPNNYELSSASDSAEVAPINDGRPVTDPYAFDPRDGFRKPTAASGFDWKTRAKEICENARKAGLNPADFGCMPEGTTVSPTFSWRGYARTICNRLQTHYYTGTAEACGCPPLNWPGWNSAAGEAAI